MEDDKLKYKLRSSLQNRYTGSHEILSVINPVVYIAAVDGTLRLVHANKMKKEQLGIEYHLSYRSYP